MFFYQTQVLLRWLSGAFNTLSCLCISTSPTKQHWLNIIGSTSVVSLAQGFLLTKGNQVVQKSHVSLVNSFTPYFFFSLTLHLSPLPQLQSSIHLYPWFIRVDQRSSVSQIARRLRIFIILLTVHLSNKTVGRQRPSHH